MDNNVTIQLLPGVLMVIDQDKFTVEANLSLSGFSEGADIKLYVDVRMNDLLTKEQSKAESLVILRTK